MYMFQPVRVIVDLFLGILDLLSMSEVEIDVQ